SGLRPCSRRRVPVMQDQRVPVLVLEERLVADAAVHRLAAELDALRLELGAGGFDVVDVQGDRARAGLELAPDLRDVDELDREAAGLELAAEVVVVALRARETERPPVELLRLLEAPDRQEDEVGARDEGSWLAHFTSWFSWALPAISRREPQE